MAGEKLFPLGVNHACGCIHIEERLVGSVAGTQLRNEVLKPPPILSSHSLYRGVVFFPELRAANVQLKVLKHLSGLASFISAFLFLSVFLECHGMQTSWLGLPCAIFLKLVYCFSFFEGRRQKTHVKNEIFIKPELNTVTLLAAWDTQSAILEIQGTTATD